STSRIVGGGTWPSRNVSRPTVAAAMAKTRTAASTAKIHTTTANGNPGAGRVGQSPDGFVVAAGRWTGAPAPAGAGLVVVGRAGRPAGAGTGPRRGGGRRSDAQPLGEQLPVVGGVAEEQLGRLGPLEVEVGRVLPGEADAAVDLDVLGGGVEVRLRAVGLGEAGHLGQLVVQLGGAP